MLLGPSPRMYNFEVGLRCGTRVRSDCGSSLPSVRTHTRDIDVRVSPRGFQMPHPRRPKPTLHQTTHLYPQCQIDDEK